MQSLLFRDMVAEEPLFRNRSRRAKSSTLSKEMELEMMWIEKAIRERIQVCLIEYSFSR